MDMIGTNQFVRSSLSFYFNNFSIVLAVLHAELCAYVRRLVFVTYRLTFMSRRLVFVTCRVMFMSCRIVFVMHRVQSVHIITNSERILGLFHNFEEDF